MDICSGRSGATGLRPLQKLQSGLFSVVQASERKSPFETFLSCITNRDANVSANLLGVSEMILCSSAPHHSDGLQIRQLRKGGSLV